MAAHAVIAAPRERRNATAKAAVQLSRVRIVELERLIRALEPADPAWGNAAREYQEHMQTVKIPNCPACGAAIDEGMLYRGDSVPPPDGGFWGEAGQRWKVCEAAARTLARLEERGLISRTPKTGAGYGYDLTKEGEIVARALNG